MAKMFFCVESEHKYVRDQKTKFGTIFRKTLQYHFRVAWLMLEELINANGSSRYSVYFGLIWE